MLLDVEIHSCEGGFKASLMRGTLERWLIGVFQNFICDLKARAKLWLPVEKHFIHFAAAWSNGEETAR